MLSLALSSAQSILQVMATVSFGYILAKSGYMKNDKQKWLSKLNMVFFTPCLLFSNIASVLSFEKLLAFWPIPVFFVCFSALSFLSSHLVSRLVGVKREFRPFVVACTMFHNTNSLPIAVISSLAVSEACKVLYWGADDTPQAVAARGITYTLLYAIFGNLLRWSYGYNLLQQQQSPLFTETDEEELDYDRSNSGGSMCRRTSSVTLSGGPDQMQRKPTETTALLFSTAPTLDDNNDKLSSNSSSSSSSSLKYTVDDGLDNRRSSPSSVLVSTAMAIHESMSPPLYAAFFALIVGLTPPLKYLMYESFLYPTLTSAIQNSAKASVPITLLGLGSQLGGISSKDDADVAGPETNKKAVATTIGIRMGLVPFIIIPTVVGFLKYGGRWSLVASDPVFGVMMIVLGCTPTAINLAQISQVTGAFENEMLRVLFWSYAVFCVPAFTLVIFIALNIVEYFA